MQMNGCRNRFGASRHCVDCGISDVNYAIKGCGAIPTGQLADLVYASVDLETTGIDAEECQILQFGMLLDDLKNHVNMLPRLEVLVLDRKHTYGGDAFALHLNSTLFEQIADIEACIAEKRQPPDIHFCYRDELPRIVAQFLMMYGWNGHDKITFAGKNFAGFDKPFLENIDFFKTIPMSHRTLDVGSMYWEPSDGRKVPDTKECLKRAGLPPFVAHTALDDAMNVVHLIRHKHGIGGRIINVTAETPVCATQATSVEKG